MAYLSDLDRNAAPYVWGELSYLLERAAQQIESDPDDASLILDGLICRIISAHYLARYGALPSRENLLSRLDAEDPALARRVRLALRAPDARARLVHARQLYALLREAEDDGERALAPLAALSSHAQG